MARVIMDYLERTSALYPDKLAFVESNRNITFKQLKEEVFHIASGIIGLGNNHEPIAVFLDKGIDCISALIGVAYSGNYYTVIDTAMPTARILKIIATLKPRLIICNKSNYDTAKSFAGNSQIAIIEDLKTTIIEADKVHFAATNVIESDILYVMFTSGSTGVPKGVITSHRAVVSYIDAVTEAYKIGSDTVIGNQAPFYFVLSILDIFCTLKNGSTMHIIPREFFTFPGKLVRYIENNDISLINWVASALSVVATLKAFNKADLSCLQTVVFGGEVMPIKHLNAWMDALPNTVFINGYGSTEVTDSATYYIVNRRFDETDLLPLGSSLPNTSVLILNENNELVKEGEIGELCVRGNNLSYGYYNDQELTDRVFVQNPLHYLYKERIYRTGDIVRLNEFDEIEYVGRKDYQIKHMGHRVELGEIEVNISSVNGIDENCCIYDSDSQKIVLYYTGTIHDSDLGTVLKELLPSYMLPNKRYRLEYMPHNLNGKIDRIGIQEKYKRIKV